jgi:TPR repeat protein
MRFILALTLLALVVLASPSRAAPHKPASAEDLATIAVFNQAWSGDEPSYLKLRKLADAGNAMAQNGVGNFYAEGKFVAKDETVALQWWTKAAEQGVPVAQYNVAQAYLRAIHHKDEFDRINTWLLKAAEQGFLNAQIDLGVSQTIPGTWFDPVQAYKWFIVGAANALAQGENGEQDALAVFAYNHMMEFAKTMTKEQIAEGESRARAWLQEYGISVEREREDLDAFIARQKARKPDAPVENH